MLNPVQFSNRVNLFFTQLATSEVKKMNHVNIENVSTTIQKIKSEVDSKLLLKGSPIDERSILESYKNLESLREAKVQQLNPQKMAQLTSAQQMDIADEIVFIKTALRDIMAIRDKVVQPSQDQTNPTMEGFKAEWEKNAVNHNTRGNSLLMRRLIMDSRISDEDLYEFLFDQNIKPQGDLFVGKKRATSLAEDFAKFRKMEVNELFRKFNPQFGKSDHIEQFIINYQKNPNMDLKDIQRGFTEAFKVRELITDPAQKTAILTIGEHLAQAYIDKGEIQTAIGVRMMAAQTFIPAGPFDKGQDAFQKENPKLGVHLDPVNKGLFKNHELMVQKKSKEGGSPHLHLEGKLNDSARVNIESTLNFITNNSQDFHSQLPSGFCKGVTVSEEQAVDHTQKSERGKVKVIEFKGVGTLRIGLSTPTEFAAMHNLISIDLDSSIPDDKVAEKLSIMLSTLGLNEPGLIYKQESISLKDLLTEVQENLSVIGYLTSELDKRDKQRSIFQKISSLFSEEILKTEMSEKIKFLKDKNSELISKIDASIKSTLKEGYESINSEEDSSIRNVAEKLAKEIEDVFKNQFKEKKDQIVGLIDKNITEIENENVEGVVSEILRQDPSFQREIVTNVVSKVFRKFANHQSWEHRKREQLSTHASKAEGNFSITYAQPGVAYLHTAKLLGKGGFKKVTEAYQVTSAGKIERVASLMIKLGEGPAPVDEKSLEREVNIAKEIQERTASPNVIRPNEFLFTYKGEKSLKVFMPAKLLFSDGDKCIQDDTYFLHQRLQPLQLVMDLCNGLHSVHQAGYVHRDIKPANIFFQDMKDHIQGLVGDLGTSLKEGEDGDFFLTPGYAAPEVLMDQKAPVQAISDMWSLGVTLFNILSTSYRINEKLPKFDPRKDTFESFQERIDATDIEHLLYNDFSVVLYEKLIKKMLVADPSKRISSEEAINILKEIAKQVNNDPALALSFLKTGDGNGMYDLAPFKLATFAEALPILQLQLADGKSIGDYIRRVNLTLFPVNDEEAKKLIDVSPNSDSLDLSENHSTEVADYFISSIANKGTTKKDNITHPIAIRMPADLNKFNKMMSICENKGIKVRCSIITDEDYSNLDIDNVKQGKDETFNRLINQNGAYFTFLYTH